MDGRLTYEQFQRLLPGASITERRGCTVHNITMGGVPASRENAEYRTRGRTTPSRELNEMRARLTKIELESRLLNLGIARK